MKIIFFLYACLSIYLPMCLCVYLSFCLSANVSIYLSICLFVYVCICLSTSFLSSNPSIYLFTCLFLYLPIYLFVYLSMYFFSQSIHLFSVCLFIYLLSLQWRIWPAKKRHFRNRLGESSVNLKTNSPKDGIYKGGREKKLINFLSNSSKEIVPQALLSSFTLLGVESKKPSVDAWPCKHGIFFRGSNEGWNNIVQRRWNNHFCFWQPWQIVW